MKNLPLSARLFVAAAVALGLCLVVVCASSGLVQQQIPQIAYPPGLGLFFSLLIISTLCAAFKVKLPLTKGSSTLSLSYAVDFAALLLLGPNLTMLIVALGTWTQCTISPRHRNPTYRILFNIAALILTVQATGHVYVWLLTWLGPDWLGYSTALVGAITVYFLTNTVLVASAVALSERQAILRTWRESYQWSAPAYLVGGIVAALAAFLIQRSWYYFAIIAAIPVYLTYHAYRVYLRRVEEEQKHVRDISGLHLATVEALALAIDAKDQRTHLHIKRMQAYAVALTKAFGLGPHDSDAVRTAALLHDIGKLAVPEHILSKPGPLTEDEVKKVRLHPVVGAEIIAQVPFPYPVAPLVLCHHERWDGHGYPSGLRGEEIPLGARMLAVIDFYDALISDRPYHPAMGPEGARHLVQTESGRAFDPAVVRAFLNTLRDTPDIVEASPSSLLKPRVIEGLSPKVAASTEGHALEDIALAHREIYGLYEIAQAMGTSLGVSDTMKMIAPKLIDLVPFSCFALYLFNETNDKLTCRFATGSDADLVRRIAVRTGHGMTGWVARNRRPLVNARPGADLEAADEAATGTTLNSALVCPLVFNGDVIGTLATYHTKPSFYTEDHCRLLDRVCEQAAAVIANSMTFERTQQESLTDQLTTLPNTRYLHANLERELSRAERLKAEVTLIVMDLDDFKDINDHYGHQSGDRALQRVAAVLRNATRPYDICVRYAGDEFIIVLPGCATEEAETRVRELQAAVEAVRFEARPGKVVELSISAGAAIYPIDGGGYESLLAIADARMYRDKTRRRASRAKAAGTGEIGADAQTVLSDLDLHRSAVGIL